MKKKIKNLIQMARKISFDELVMLSDEEESAVESTLKELKKEELIKIRNDMIIYSPAKKTVTRLLEDVSGENNNCIKTESLNINTENILPWAVKRLLIYKKMFDDSRGLEKSNKLKFFIEKYSQVNNIEIITQATFMTLREDFYEKGEKYFLEHRILKPMHKHEIINKLYSFYKDVYLDATAPTSAKALSLAREKFFSMYPEYPSHIFMPPSEFTNRLSKEFTHNEVKYYRNKIKWEGKIPEIKKERKYYIGKPILFEFADIADTPDFIEGMLSGIVYDLQQILIDNPELYYTSKEVQGEKYRYKFENKDEKVKLFSNPDKLLDYLVILSHIQNKKEKIDGFTKSSSDEVLFFRGKVFKTVTKKGSYNNCSEPKMAMMQELRVLSNVSFLNGDKYEPIIEFKKIDDKKMHQDFNFYFKINSKITEDEHFIDKKILCLNPKCHIRTKRCGYYLDRLWQKRVFLKPILVRNLMEKIYIDKEKFIRRGQCCDCKKILEQSINMLKKEGIIKDWIYYDWQESRKTGWFDKWLNSHIIVEPTEKIIKYYSTADDIINFDNTRLSEFIANLNMPQRAIIEDVSISRSILVKINKHEVVRNANMLKIKAFCEKQEGCFC